MLKKVGLFRQIIKYAVIILGIVLIVEGYVHYPYVKSVITGKVFIPKSSECSMYYRYYLRDSETQEEHLRDVKVDGEYLSRIVELLDAQELTFDILSDNDSNAYMEKIFFKTWYGQRITLWTCIDGYTYLENGLYCLPSCKTWEIQKILEKESGYMDFDNEILIGP